MNTLNEAWFTSYHHHMVETSEWQLVLHKQDNLPWAALTGFDPVEKFVQAVGRAKPSLPSKTA